MEFQAVGVFAGIDPLQVQMCLRHERIEKTESALDSC
jgi:hypothetical protein